MESAGPQRPGNDGGPPCVPGDGALMQDAASFADAVFSEVNPIGVAAKLLKSKDERISQRQLERLLDLRFGRSGTPPMEDMPKIVWDLPRPDRG